MSLFGGEFSGLLTRLRELRVANATVHQYPQRPRTASLVDDEDFECASYEKSKLTCSLRNAQNRREYEVDIEDLSYTNFLAEFVEQEEGSVRFPAEYKAMMSESEFEDHRRKFKRMAEEQVVDKNCEMLKDLVKRTKMLCIQENGQRRFGPKVGYRGDVPPRGSEVFVGKIPRDCFEPDLYPIFEKAGEVYEIRMMMDFSGSNRGYCFVQFHTPEEAQKAIKTINNYEIRKGRLLGVVLSVDNCRLFVGGIPKDKSNEEILQEISKLTSDVVKVVCYPSINDKTKNRGFAFVQYETHKAAAMARRKLIPGKITMFGVQVAVDWADPEPDVENEIMDKVKILYVRNLMLETTEETLLELFNECSDNSVEKVKKIKDFAFIHFSSREKAEMAKVTFTQGKETPTIDGSKVEINWAKPPNCKGTPVQKSDGKKKSPHLNGYGHGQRPGSYLGDHYSTQSYYYGNGSSIMMSPNGSNYHPSQASYAGSMYGPPSTYSEYNNGNSPTNGYNPVYNNGNSPSNYGNFNNGNSPPSYNAYNNHNGTSSTNYNYNNGTSSTNYNAYSNGNAYNNGTSPTTSYNYNERNLNLHNYGYTGVYRNLLHNMNMNNGSAAGIMSANNNESRGYGGYPQLAGGGNPYNNSTLSPHFLYN